MFSVILYSLFKVNEFTHVGRETKVAVQRHLKKLNVIHGSKYGLEWKASANLFWIELRRLED